MTATDPSPPGDAPIPPERLRAAMSRFPTGVTVITALTEDGPAGLAANAVTSLSLDPPLMLACVDRGARTLRSIEAAGRFAVNVLEAEAADIAQGFGRKVPVAEKWLGVGWSEIEGLVVLDAAIVSIGCELRDVISGGDHVIVTGEVTSITERDGQPLLFHAGVYRPLD
jgi:flavin reductase (DIM6/NTAB) family NADH-FMN oxidoreductase RutF